jgi:predicted DNA binding protein
VLIARVLVRHEDCWTSRNNHAGRTLALNFYPDRGYLRSIIHFTEPTKIQGNGVIRIIESKKVNHGYIIDFLNTYNDSIAGLLHKSGAFIIYNEVFQQKELWVFLTYRYSLNEIDSLFKTSGEVVTSHTQVFNPPPLLTQEELKVLKTAVESGYYNFPRGVDLGQLSKTLRVKKPTLLYRLRSATKKLIKHYCYYTSV